LLFYLPLQCRNLGIKINDTIQSVLKHVQNARAITLLEDDPNNNMHYQVLLCHRDSNPELYEFSAYPTAWRRGLPLHAHVDVPMHLLFLGVTKTVVKRIMEWSKAHSLQNNFLRASSGVLDAVGSCHLEWCVALKITGPNFGGWVSENYLALPRLCKWFFSMLPVLNEDEQFIEPDRPYTTWSVKELKGWLRNCGLNDKRRKSELLERIQCGKECSTRQSNVIVSQEYSINDVSIVLNVIQCLSDMISNLMMQKIDEDHISKTKLLIMQFLSGYHKMDKALQIHINATTKKRITHHHQSSDKETYGWLTSYNFICLINLPTMMERYGPITNLWKGGMIGEKFSQELKPRLRGGLTRNWHVNVLKDVLKDDALSRMELPTATPEVKQPVSYIMDGRYVKYKTTLDVITKYNERQPIAVVNFENNGP
jgi:hypothetical protein